MSDNKKYYYLKLKDNFFDSEEMKLLESHPQGDKYQNIYLKLCLLSLKNGGKLIFRDGIPYDLNMLSIITRKDIGVVKDCISILKSFGLLDIMETGEIYMTDMQSLIGHSSTENDRVKEYREKIKVERNKCTNLLQKCTPEIKIDIKDKDKDIIKKNEIDDIYNLYPNKCPIANRPTGKSTKDKIKIKSLLDNHGFEELSNIITEYVKQCINSKCYIKNFSTFLNNIPDLESMKKENIIQPPKEIPKKRESEGVDLERLDREGKLEAYMAAHPHEFSHLNGSL